MVNRSCMATLINRQSHKNKTKNDVIVRWKVPS